MSNQKFKDMLTGLMRWIALIRDRIKMIIVHRFAEKSFSVIVCLTVEFRKLFQLAD
jgi:hypothetical protein